MSLGLPIPEEIPGVASVIERFKDLQYPLQPAMNET